MLYSMRDLVVRQPPFTTPFRYSSVGLKYKKEDRL